MKTLLVINATMDKSSSHTYFIYNHIINNLDINNYNIKELNLYEMNIPFLNPELILDKNNDIIDSKTSKNVDDMSLEFCNADGYIFICPTWNFSVPGILKAYIDLICDVNRVFKYTSNGPIGLLEGKKSLVINTSGGSSTTCIDYLNQLTHFMGLDNKNIFIPDTAFKYNEYSDMLTNIVIERNYFS